MARPIKDNADYFSHDTSMRDDPRLKALRRKFKHEGYSIWNMLLESITDADNFRFNINYEIMAGDYDIEPEKLREIVSYCVELGLLQSDAETSIIWSKTLDSRMSTLLSKRKRNRNPADGELSTSENPQSKGKESKAFVFIGEPKGKYLIVLARLANERPKKIFDLPQHFERTGQLDGFKSKGFVHFEAFMDAHAAKMFNDDMHLDNTFRNFCDGYKPPARAPNKFLDAEVNLGIYTIEAWKETYAWDLKYNEEFKRYFNGKLSSSQPMGSNDKH